MLGPPILLYVGSEATPAGSGAIEEFDNSIHGLPDFGIDFGPLEDLYDSSVGRTEMAEGGGEGAGSSCPGEKVTSVQHALHPIEGICWSVLNLYLDLRNGSRALFIGNSATSFKQSQERRFTLDIRWQEYLVVIGARCCFLPTVVFWLTSVWHFPVSPAQWVETGCTIPQHGAPIRSAHRFRFRCPLPQRAKSDSGRILCA